MRKHLNWCVRDNRWVMHSKTVINLNDYERTWQTASTPRRWDIYAQSTDANTLSSMWLFFHQVNDERLTFPPSWLMKGHSLRRMKRLSWVLHYWMNLNFIWTSKQSILMLIRLLTSSSTPLMNSNWNNHHPTPFHYYCNHASPCIDLHFDTYFYIIVSYYADRIQLWLWL